MNPVKTTCPYCGVGCGIIATPGADGAVAIKGDPDHPANLGRLCSKGLALGETLGLGQRLLHPRVQGQNNTWEAATALVADKFNSTIAEHGPDSVAFYVSGQFLTEDYYVANKLMKGFIGSANIDTNSRLCMASAVAGHKRAFGADVVPCSYDDLEQADLVVLVGSNLAWCHPVLFQRLEAARQTRGTKLVVIDPRPSATAEVADLHLPLRPQSDVALFNGLFHHLYSAGTMDQQFVSQHTGNIAAALEASNSWSLSRTAEACDLDPALLEQFFELFAKTQKAVTAFSMGVNQSTSGTDKVNAIINVHLLTGRISKPGAGPFSITGQPNAMGGREVGGLANMLAAHMEIENAAHRNSVQEFWNAPRMPEKAGLKAVDLFEAVKAGRIKALWIMATNPAVSMPDSAGVAEALRGCPFVVVSDVTANTETAQYAHVLLPALGWGEKFGTVTNSERCISRQRNFLPGPGEAKPDWQIMSDVARQMGFVGFDYASPAEIFAEHVALTQLGNAGSRRFDLSDWQGEDYEAMEPRQWGGARPFADGNFQTQDGKAQFVGTFHVEQPHSAYVLNTGRIRDQWHTMTRTGLVPRLFGHRAELHAEISAADAKTLGVGAAELIEIAGQGESLVARSLVKEGMRAGEVFVPMHWSSTFAKSSKVNMAMAAKTDPFSGQPALKSGAVQLARFAVQWHGFGMSVEDFDLDADYLAKRPLDGGGLSFECAGKTLPENWEAFLDDAVSQGALTSLKGSNSAAFRCVILKEAKLQFAFFAAPLPVEVSRSWLQGQLGREVNALAILAGRPMAHQKDLGPMVCACMNVGVNHIADYIARNPTAGLDDVCHHTKAGTGCGSCRIEVRKMINEAAKPRQAAE